MTVPAETGGVGCRGPWQEESQGGSVGGRLIRGHGPASRRPGILEWGGSLEEMVESRQEVQGKDTCKEELLKVSRQGYRQRQISKNLASR